MRILFVSALDHASESSVGVAAKLESQARACSALGHTVFVSKDYGLQTRIFRDGHREPIEVRTHLRKFSRSAKYRFLGHWIRRNRIDAAIVRFDHFDPAFCRFSKQMKENEIVVALELPTFPFDSERALRHEKLLSGRRYAKYLLHRAFVKVENGYIRHADRYIDYTISYLDVAQIWDCPNITFDNGIDAATIPLKAPKSDDTTVNLLCVAKFAPHHGVDRLLRGLAEYNGARDVRVVLAGSGIESPNLMNLAKDLGLDSRVRFEGTVLGDQLNRLFDSANVAVGSLGLHRIGISQGSTMKSREYCARGIPFVYAFSEKGFDGSEDFTLLLPSTNDPVEINEVIGFSDRVSYDTDLSARMRDFASTHFDWKAQMIKVLSVLEGRLADDARGG